jgi:Raf kinase inhibitor-like YbhB/YbcL family protein
MIKFKILISISILFFIFGCSGGGSSNSTDNGTKADNNTVIDNSTSDVNPPTVSSTSPASGDNSISISNNVTINFSEEMDPATINTSNITVQDSSGNSVSGVVSYNERIATFTPATDLSYFTVYTVTVGIGVKDSAGNALASNSSWNFTTSSAPDTIAPTISSTSPSSGATDISISSDVTITFSEEMDSSTINTSNITVQDSGGNSVSGAVSYSSKVATFNPTSDLSHSTVYTVTVGTGVKDTSGNALASSLSRNFTTAAVLPSISLTSSAFNKNGDIPAVYTCDGTDISPALSWSGNLDTAVSFALIMDDPDAPGGTFTHWMIYNIPSSARSLTQNLSTAASLLDGSRQLANDFPRTGYSGPCPPSRHQYNFTIYALSANLSTSIITKSQLTSAMTGKIVAQDTYSGFYP